MATLPNIFDRWISSGTIAEAAAQAPSREMCDAHKLRPLPNEDVFFYAKRIDNSRVVRQADPLARAREWKVVGVAGVAVLACISILLPSAYGLMAGYQLSALYQEHQQLKTERALLEFREARLVSAERLQELARTQEFVDPVASKTVYLEPRNEKALALNRR